MSDSLYDPKEYDFVPKYYQMDPETEDLLPGSSQLLDGMKVLIASPNLRERPEDGAKDWVFDRLVTNSRWCTVTHLEVLNSKYQSSVVQFIGVYENGSKVFRTHGKETAWFVKKDSVTSAKVAQTNRYRMLHDMVGTLLKSTPPSSEFFDDQVEEITQQIIRMFS